MNLKKILNKNINHFKNNTIRKFVNLKNFTKYKLGNKNDKNHNLVIIRIIGNDLWPLHSKQQSIDNISYIIDNENNFQNCKKIYILNRIFDPVRQEKLLEILKRNNVDHVIIPFEKTEYAKIGLDFEPFGGSEFFESTRYLTSKENVQTMMKLAVFRRKIIYAMNINGARNRAMEIGAEHGDWVLPWDGNCTLSSTSFDMIRKSCTSRPYLPIKVIPMIRQERGQDPYSSSILVNRPQEPQLVLHRSLKQPFNEHYAYGSRDKTELLARIGLPGPWMSEKAHFFFPETETKKGYEFQYEILDARAIRLASGMDKLDQGGDRNSIRHSTRNESIFRTLCWLEGTKYEDFLSFSGKATER